jgi:hypothetical protein
MIFFLLFLLKALRFHKHYVRETVQSTSGVKKNQYGCRYFLV